MPKNFTTHLFESWFLVSRQSSIQISFSTTYSRSKELKSANASFSIVWIWLSANCLKESNTKGRFSNDVISGATLSTCHVQFFVYLHLFDILIFNSGMGIEFIPGLPPKSINLMDGVYRTKTFIFPPPTSVTIKFPGHSFRAPTQVWWNPLPDWTLFASLVHIWNVVQVNCAGA